ncbi:MAG: MOSC domain-containing protein [Erythrobacter sp.]
MNNGTVFAVHSFSEHAFAKTSRDEIEIIAGIGVAGDAHAGAKVQHLSRVRADPNQPNLRQVHLIHGELFDEIAASGFDVRPGQLGENITTSGVDLLALGRDDRIHIGNVVLRVTGLRNPCAQIEAFRQGLLQQLVYRDGDEIVRKAGIMTIAESGGKIRPGDSIEVEPAPGPRIKLDRA